MDVLGDVLAVAGVRGAIAATVDAGEGWGLRLDAVPDAAFHAITGGTAWLRTSDGPPVHLMPGDVVLFPTGRPHALSSAPDSSLTPWDHVAAGPDYERTRAIAVGTPPTRTRILCASFRHDPAVSTPLFTLLPEVMHVPSGTTNAALEGTVRLIATELAGDEPASDAVLNRLVDIVLIQILRGWLRSVPAAMPLSWLRALSDPTVAAALGAMHADPARRWTIDTLAAHAAVSRATLARRFAGVVGTPPAAYLTRWRMDLAARRLRDSDDPIDLIARSVGYDSVYAFSRAFARDRALSPGRYRTASRRDTDN